MPTRFGKIISGKHFSKLFLLLYILFMGVAAYETDKALCLLTNRPHLYGISYIIFAIVAVLIMAKKNIALKWPNQVFKKMLSFLSCFFIYYLLTLLSWEVVCIVFRPAEMVNAIGVVGSFAVAVLIVLCGYLHTKSIKVKPYQLALGSGNEEYRIALISDIHLGIFVGEKHAQRIVQKINALEPDLVVISGDIFDVDNSLLARPDQLKRISKQFSKIRASDGVYAVAGNHDPKVSDKTFAHFLKTSGIKLLDNGVVVLSDFNLVGRTDDAHNYRSEFADLLPKIKPEKKIIVLDHDPKNIDEDAKNGAALVLSGHTHRGQMFPITLFTKWANGKNRFYGHKIFGQTHGIITSGVGFFELPVRIGTSNEIVEITIKPEQI